MNWLTVALWMGLSAIASSVQALPLGDITIGYVQNGDGTFTYSFKIRNPGPPVAPAVFTPPDHQIMDRLGNSYFAGGKALDDDKNIVLFGIDTGQKDVVVTDIGNGTSAFHGTQEMGFAGTVVVAWHLPFSGFTLDDTIRPGQIERGLTFTLNKRITHFQYWIGGSDNIEIWNDQHVMVEDMYGIYDATSEKFLATFLTRATKARKLSQH